MEAERSADGVVERMPILAMTANSMDGDRQRCLDAGMDDYISKPLRLATLSEALGRWLVRK